MTTEVKNLPKMYQFNIYKKSSKICINRNHIIHMVLVFCFIVMIVKLLIFKSNKFSIFEAICFCITISTIFVGRILQIVYRNKFKKLNGNLESRLKLENDKILVDEIIYDLSEIEKLEFNCNDYKGLSTFEWFGNRVNYENGLSNGTNNSIMIKMNNNTTYTYYFQQQKENEICNAKSQLINYYNTGKLHFLNLIDTLGIKEYEEIQIFKSTLLIRN